MFSNYDLELAVIDLDNTLYAADNGVFARMDKKMNQYIQRELGVDAAEANKIRVKYWKEYGSTVKGLMEHHGHDAEPFLREVHDIDAHELLAPNIELHAVFEMMPMRKVIHTNGTTEHAETILAALGIRNYFDEIYDIRFNQYTPKPNIETLHQIFKQEAVEAERVIVIDDMQDNLVVAKRAGAKTAWVHADASRVSHNWDISASSFSGLLKN
ncbi:MAG: pyrimidine 5'-nucleotidase [Ghiorsea sp.]